MSATWSRLLQIEFNLQLYDLLYEVELIFTSRDEYYLGYFYYSRSTI